MPRATNAPASRRRHRKRVKLAKGYYNARGRLYKLATFTLLKALRYAYRDRLAKKRDFRRLWITRIGAASNLNDLSYSKFMAGLKKAGIGLNRKMLADLAVHDEQTFASLVATAKEALKT